MTPGGQRARTTPPFEADERVTLTAFLDFQRATLALKCDGLTEHQLKERAVPPSPPVSARHRQAYGGGGA